MIRDGVILIDVRTSVLQFDSDVVNVILLALLSTLLSYQLTAICFNIFFGNKQEGRAAASDIHKLILTEVSKPVTILAAIVRADFLDRLRFEGDLPRNMKIARRATHVRAKVTLTLIVLLLSAPVFNLISVFVILQRDEMLTFGDTDFGGLALSVGRPNISRQSFTPDCDRVRLEAVSPASSVVQFTECVTFEIDFQKKLTSERIRFAVETTVQGQIMVSIIPLPSNIPISTMVSLALTSGGRLFRIQPVLSVENAINILHKGQNILALFCDSANRTNSPQNESLVSSNGLVKVSKEFENCSPSLTEVIDVMSNMMEAVEVVEQTHMNVVNMETLSVEADSPPDYFDAGDLPFVIRRSHNLNLLVFVVVVAAAFLIGMITSYFFNNDLDEALEAVVRYRLGVDPRESILRSARTVRYNSKGHGSGMAHYGLQKRSLPEVEHFEGGIEIGVEESSNLLRSRGEW